MNRLRDYNLNAFILLLLAFLLGMCLISGCTLENAVKKVTKTEVNAKVAQQAINAKHEKVVAENCADLYPVEESEVTPGKEVIEEETTEQEPMVVPCEDDKGQPVKEVKCPPATVTLRTVYRTDTIRVRDRAQERAYQIQQVETQKALTKETEAHTATLKTLEETKQERNRAYWFGGILIAAIIGFVAIKVLKPF